MNKINKAQRDQIIAILMGTVILVVGIYYGVICGQQQKIAQVKAQTEKARSKTFKASQLIAKGADIKDHLDARAQVLSGREATMAPERDMYAWMLNTIKPLLFNHRDVSLIISQPDPISDMSLLPHFFYKVAVFHVKGVAHFHDLGSFLADLENGFTYFRVQGLDVMPSNISNLSSSGAGEGSGVGHQASDVENLDFRFDIVVPVKPSDSVPATK